jgi:hypothetical protein
MNEVIADAEVLKSKTEENDNNFRLKGDYIHSQFFPGVPQCMCVSFFQLT